MENYQTELTLAQSTNVEKTEFYRKTYLHVALAFLAFVLVEYVFLSSETMVNIGLQMALGWT